MRCRRFVALILFLSGTPQLANEVSADKSGEVTVVILHSGQDALVANLSAEIASSGFRPEVILEGSPGHPSEGLQAVASRLGAVAGMRVLASGRGVEVWVSDPASGVNVATEVLVGKESDRASALLSLKAVELLRASLIKIAEEQKPRKKVSSREPEAKPPTPREGDAPPVLSFALQPTVSWGSGGLPVTMHLHIGFYLRLPKWLGLQVFGFVPTFAMRIKEEEGSADIRVGTVAVGLYYELLKRERFLQPRAGAGVGPGFLRMRGHAAETFEDGDELLIFGVGYLTAGVAFALSRVVSLRVDVVAGWAFPRPVVRFVERNVADWGRPLVSGMFGFETWLL
jgi:hypothetical protein